MNDERRVREARFTRLYDAHYSAVRAYAWRRGPDEADDVVAETFTIAWRRLDDIPPQALPWLLAVARNVLLNLRRGERRRLERETRSADPASAPSCAPAMGEGSSLRSVLERLPERDREILLLVSWDGLDRVALATVLGCTRTAAAVRLFRAKKRLAAALSEAQARPRVHPADSRGGLDEC
jgi:RNA polymerase sigma-70 factor (ECF subfamily)